ncbi:hypothetical protein JCM8097_002634 [Rhodosporidiobolus ruineniae]
MEETATPLGSSPKSANGASAALATTAPPSPPDAVFPHYQRLFAALLRTTTTAQDAGPPGGANGATSSIRDGPTTWAMMRGRLEGEHGRSDDWMRGVDQHLEQGKDQARQILHDLEQLGADELARECLALEREAFEAGDEDKALVGTVAVLEWITAAKAVLARQAQVQPYVLPSLLIQPNSLNFLPHSPVGAINNDTPSDQHIATASTQTDSFTSASNGFGFIESSPAAEAKPQFVSPSEVSGPSSSSAAAAPAPALSAAAPSATPVASTSASTLLPYYSTPVAPSPGFAPPPAAGAIPKPKKSRGSSAGSRRTSLGVVKAKGASEVYHPPEAGDSNRPQRKRKLPKTLTFEQSSDPFDDEPPAKKGKAGKGKGKAPPPPPPEDEEIDELASDYEEQYGSARSVSVEQKQVQEEEEGDDRFKVGEAVMARFPNYGPFPSLVLDPRDPPPNTQGKRIKGSYLVKSIPAGADHRWVPPEEPHIRALTPAELDEIVANKYATPPPKSWKQYREDLVEAVRLIRNPAELKDWASRPTELEVILAAEQERKKQAKATAAW